MSKLLKFKQWLTLEDAAAYMTSVMSEPVVVADILQLALDHHLRLSVDLVNHANGKRGKIKSATEAGTWKMPHQVTLEEDLGEPDSRGRRRRRKGAPDRGWTTVDFPAGRVIEEDRILVADEPVYSMAGIWDIPLIGGERIDIENMLQKEIGGPPVNLTNIDGGLLANPSDADELWAVQDHYDYFETNPVWLERKRNGQSLEGIEMKTNEKAHSFIPAHGLPEGSLVIVRLQELQRFLSTLVDAPETTDKVLGKREKDGLLTIIAILCKEAKLDYEKASKTADLVQDLGHKMGLSIGETTIEQHLKKIPDALATRMK